MKYIKKVDALFIEQPARQNQKSTNQQGTKWVGKAYICSKMAQNIYFGAENGRFQAERPKGRCQKKTGFCGRNSQTGGSGLTQTHSIFFQFFSNSGA